MTHRSIKIKFRELQELKSLLAHAMEGAIERGEPYLQAKDEIYFSSYKDYLQAMSEQKYAILAVVREKKPGSVYQLAKILGRDFPNVKKDCDYLEQVGLLIQKKLLDARNTKKPELIFDYDEILIFSPSCTYAFHLAPHVAA